MTNLTPFQKLLHDQIANEFDASQQYIAIAVYFDKNDLFRLAKYFYRQAVEERNHAMMMVQYFLDRDLDVVIPGIGKVQTEFKDHHAPLLLAYEQEQRVTKQIVELASTARSDSDYIGEQFMLWFLKEQVEEVDTMRTLITVSERAKGNTFDLEEYIARELSLGTVVNNAAAPEAAGGAL